MLGILAIIKLKEHVEDPRSTPLKESMVRFTAGGCLFALPVVFEAALNTINPGIVTGGMIGAIQNNSELTTGIKTSGGASDFNNVLSNIIASVQSVPGLFTGVSYLLALVFSVAGVLKFKDHILNSDQTPMKEGVIRLLAAGCLFGLPAIFMAMYNTIAGGAGPGPGFLNGLASTTISQATEDSLKSSCAASSGLGSVICNVFGHTSAFPVFLTGIAYLLALGLAIWGVLKVKGHVENPHQTSVWEGMSYLLTSGGLLALPTVMQAAFTTLSNGIGLHNNTGLNDTGFAAKEAAAKGAGTPLSGLDVSIMDLMTNIFGPLNIFLDFFGYVAGIILLMIGITRLTKGIEEGPRGPGGMGTIATFAAGAALLSFSPMISAFSVSLLDTPTTTTFGAVTYTAGLSTVTSPTMPSEVELINASVAATVKLLIVLGLGIFLRGIFIVRGAVQGNNQQASMMAGITHLIAGALAVNFGPLTNAIQATLGTGGAVLFK